MSSDRSDESAAKAVEVVAHFISTSDPDQLRAAYEGGRITKDQFINEIAARFQRSVGGTVQAVAEHDKDLALQIGQRLRSRIDEQIAVLASRDTPGAIKEKKPASGLTVESFKDRTDAVLRREWAILSGLTKGNASPLKTAEITKIARSLEPELQENSVTAHLTRLVDVGAIEKISKGRYQASADTRPFMAKLAEAIAARDLSLPKLDG